MLNFRQGRGCPGVYSRSCSTQRFLFAKRYSSSIFFSVSCKLMTFDAIEPERICTILRLKSCTACETSAPSRTDFAKAVFARSTRRNMTSARAIAR